MSHHKLQGDGFTVGFSNQEVTAWGGLALLKRMLESLEFREAFVRFGIPETASNRGYPAVQLIEQFIVSIWCGACRFAHAEVVRLDKVLCRLFGWPCAAEFKAIMRLFRRFDMLTNERVQEQTYRWLFGKLSTLSKVTLDLDSTVVTRNGSQEGAERGYNPNRRGRASHHPLLAFVAERGWSPTSGFGLAMSIVQIMSCNFSNRLLSTWLTRPSGSCWPIADSLITPSCPHWSPRGSTTLSLQN